MDHTHDKRVMVAVGSFLIAVASILIVGWTSMPVIIAAQGLTGLAGAIFAPTIAAISLGMVGHSRFGRRMGRNASFNSAGNLVMAAATASSHTSLQKSNNVARSFPHGDRVLVNQRDYNF